VLPENRKVLVANEMLGKQNVQSFTESNVFAHHNFGERALTIILNQNSDFATTLNSIWLQNDKSQSSF
jgi:hypothetical protein